MRRSSSLVLGTVQPAPTLGRHALLRSSETDLCGMEQRHATTAGTHNPEAVLLWCQTLAQPSSLGFISVSLVSSLLFWVTTPWQSWLPWLRTALKLLSIAPLLAVVYRYGLWTGGQLFGDPIAWVRRRWWDPGEAAAVAALPRADAASLRQEKARSVMLRRNRVLLAGIAFHMIGDALIAQGWTVPSMVPFCLGHLAYQRMFMHDLRICLATMWQKIGKLTIMCSYAAALAVFLVPKFPGFLQPVVAFYIVAISSVLFCACLSAHRLRLMAVGALLYVASDSLIGLSTFILPQHWLLVRAIADSLSWPLYYCGQALIVSGFLLERNHVRCPSRPSNVSLASLANPSDSPAPHTKLPPSLRGLFVKHFTPRL